MDEPLTPRHGVLNSDLRDAFYARAAEDDGEEKAALAEEERKRKIVELALKRYRICADAENAQRLREQEDLQFARGELEDQWPEVIVRDRQGGQGTDGRVTPARPILVVNKLRQPLLQVLNEARQARISIDIKPQSDATQEEADLRQDLIRSIEVKSKANQARLWALDRAIQCGRGFYRILKEYSNDGDFDQDLVIAPILNQGSVYLDPFAQKPDFSDMEWAIITTDLPESEYKLRFPDSNIADSANEMSTVGDDLPGWVMGNVDGGERTIRVAEYFYVENEIRTIYNLNGQIVPEEALPEGFVPAPNIQRREVPNRKVKWCLINAKEVLEEQEWDGRFIPVVPVLGMEFNVDGNRCWKGIVSDSKDSQRMFNYMVSALCEAIGLAPRAPWLIAEGQIEGYEGMWQQANTRNFPYLVYRNVDVEGKPVPLPQRNTAEPVIGAIVEALRDADMNIKATTGRQDPSLGKLSGERSGKAINALRAAGEISTSQYLDNLAQISMPYEAEILLDLIPFTYDSPGRVMTLLGQDGKTTRNVVLNAPFTTDQQGNVQVQQPGFFQGMRRMMGAGPQTTLYDMNKGTFGVVVSVGKAFQTQREENVAMMQSFMEAAPQLAPMFADLLFENVDSPMAKAVVERLRMLNPQIDPNKGNKDVPPQLMQQIEQMHQAHQAQVQAMGAQLQEYKQQIDADTAKSNADIQKAMIDAQSRERVAVIQARAALMKQRMGDKADLDEAFLDAETRRIDTMVEHSHQADMANQAAKNQPPSDGASA